jgi:drug/metabolite transporter (DMT)-like permease
MSTYEPIQPLDSDYYLVHNHWLKFHNYKIVLDSISPLFAFSIRFIITGGVLILGSYILDRKNQEIKEFKLWKNALIIGAILIVGGHELIAWGTQCLSAGIAALLNSTIPLWVVLFMYLLVFFGTVVPSAEFCWLLKVTTPPIANTFAYIASIVAVFLGWAILNESVTYLTIIATIIILTGVALIVRTLNNK